MRARIFAIARFAVYAVVIAIGVSHLVGRDTASGETPDSDWTSVEGRTTQGFPITVQSWDGKVRKVELAWRGTCAGGATTDWGSRFTNGEFERDGERFAARRTATYVWAEGRTGELAGRLEGEAADGVIRGSVHLKLHVFESGGERPANTCESGPVGFALDLPR